MDETVKVGDEVFVRADGRRAIVSGRSSIFGLYLFECGLALYRYEFVPVKWMDDKVGNTGIGVCAKNGSEG